MNLFTTLEEENKQKPLAEILRPETLDDFFGQTDIVAENTAIYNLLKSKRLFSLILWGPPGCGKTTLARIITKTCEANFIELSAVMSGVKEIKDAVEKAKESLRYGQKTILFIDEIHRYSKTQQDALLPHLENGTLYLIGSTTENPSFQVIPALLSRVQTLILKPLERENIIKLIHKGFAYLAKKHGDINVDENIFAMIADFSGGDARYALNLVENAYFAANFVNNKRVLRPELVENLAQNKQVRYSKQEHYDCASAFQKSLRGSDPNAAIYYLAKMIKGGDYKNQANFVPTEQYEDVKKMLPDFYPYVGYSTTDFPRQLPTFHLIRTTTARKISSAAIAHHTPTRPKLKKIPKSQANTTEIPHMEPIPSTVGKTTSPAARIL